MVCLLFSSDFFLSPFFASSNDIVSDLENLDFDPLNVLSRKSSVLAEL